MSQRQKENETIKPTGTNKKVTSAEQPCPLNDEQDQVTEEKRLVKVRISLFFDGTANNRTNTAIRLQAEAIAVSGKSDLTAEEKKAQKLFKKHGSDISYENDFSNIARLEKVFEKIKIPEKEYVLSVYTEGCGTKDEKGDNAVGLGLGMGGGWIGTGVKYHVKKGLDNALGKIRELRVEKSEIKLQITLDTFGFSRGATAARHCVYKAMVDKKTYLKNKLRPSAFRLTLSKSLLSAFLTPSLLTAWIIRMIPKLLT